MLPDAAVSACDQLRASSNGLSAWSGISTSTAYTAVGKLQSVQPAGLMWYKHAVFVTMVLSPAAARDLNQEYPFVLQQ